MSSTLLEDALARLGRAAPKALAGEARFVSCTACHTGGVKHVLHPCGHAVLCGDCIREAPSCPLCGSALESEEDASRNAATTPSAGGGDGLRTPLSRQPSSRPRLTLRLYDACVYAGLIGQLGTWKEGATGSEPAAVNGLGLASRRLAPEFEHAGAGMPRIDSGYALGAGGAREGGPMDDEGSEDIPGVAGAAGHTSGLPLDVRRLFALFDIATDYGLVSVITQYIQEVCCDSGSVSSSAETSLLLDARTVLHWARAAFGVIRGDLSRLYASIEDSPAGAVASSLLSVTAGRLQAVVQVVQGLTGVAATFLEDAAAQEAALLLEAVQRVRAHVLVMEWWVAEPLFARSPLRFSSQSEWQAEQRRRRDAAAGRATPDLIATSGEPLAHHAPRPFLFIDSAVSSLFSPRSPSQTAPTDYASLDTPTAYRVASKERAASATAMSLGLNSLCGRQFQVDAIAGPARGDGTSASVVYPPRSFRLLVDTLFLDAPSAAPSALLAVKILLYWLCDAYWLPHEEGPEDALLPPAPPLVAQRCATALEAPAQAAQEAFLWALLDDCSTQALQQATEMLKGLRLTTGTGGATGGSAAAHSRIARTLLERQRAPDALEALRTALRDRGLLCASSGSPLGGQSTGALGAAEPRANPGGRGAHTGANAEALGVPLDHAVTVLRVLLQSSTLAQAFSYLLWYTSGEPEAAAGAAREALVAEVCWFCIGADRVRELINLPWRTAHVPLVHRCLVARARQKASSSSGSLLVVLYLERSRFSEALAASKEVEAIEQQSLGGLGDAAEEQQAIRQNQHQRHTLLEACQSLLPRTKALAPQSPLLPALQLSPSHSVWAGVPWGPTSPQRGAPQPLPVVGEDAEVSGLDTDGPSWHLDAPQDGARGAHGMRSPEEAHAWLHRLSPHPKLASSTEEAVLKGTSGSAQTPGAPWGAGLLLGGPTAMGGALSGVKRHRRDVGRTPLSTFLAPPLSTFKGQGAQGASLLASDVARSMVATPDSRGWGLPGNLGTPQVVRGTPLGSGLANANANGGLAAMTPRETPGGASPGLGQTPLGQLASGGARGGQRVAMFSAPLAASPLATPSFEKGKSPLEMAFRVTPLRQAGLASPLASREGAGAGAAHPQVAPGAFKGITFGGKWAGVSSGDADDEEGEDGDETPDRRPPAPAARGRDVQVRPGLVTGMVSYWGGPPGKR